MIFIALFFTLLSLAIYSNAFHLNSISTRKGTNVLSMEYIPTGLTKQQWEQIKKKEEEELKKKGNLGVLGVNKFKSRSLQAWQESGGKHLFPVNPKTTSYEERPYMQRKNGDWEGNDLKSKGLEGKGQGTPYERLKTDNLYEGLQKEGKLNSVSIFGGAALPWTSKQANEVNQLNWTPAQRGVAGKKLSPEEIEKLKSKLVKPVVSKTSTETTTEPEKKKLFGLF